MGEKDITGSFFEFQKLCVQIEDENSYNGKTKIVENHLKHWKGDVYLLCRLLLARDDPRVYNLREKAFAKVLSRIFDCDTKDVLEDFEKGDMSETSKKFFEEYGTPQKKSTLTLGQVDAFLNSLIGVTKEDDQTKLFTEFLKKCTGNDLKYLWKIIDHDLKINIGPKFVLAAFHPKAFDAYMKSNDLRQIIDRVINHTLDQKLKEDKTNNNNEKAEGGKSGLSTDLTLMTPVKPMLAKATKTAEDVIKRCPNTAYGEVKYDGERIQIHKQGENFTFYSRNLKPILPWKVEGVREYIPKSTDATDVILDGEILLMDTKKRKPLPFGTLGIHKKNQFQDATVCVFFFDILYLDGKTLTSEPMEKRRQLLEENVKVIPNRIELSEYTMIKKTQDVNKLMQRCIREGLEGLVIKDLKSIYEPNARHWLKMKKDYLQGMADSADLLVLGAYYGTGNKGGLMSVFLMGVYDKESDTYKTVCKVGNGHDDDTINRLQKELKMVKISQDYSKVPDWLDVHRMHTPDFVAADPKKTPVWEIEGAEFSASNHHTAANISIRFPRVVKIRDDKDWSTATNLDELKQLAAASTRSNPHKDVEEGEDMDDDKEDDEEDEEEAPKKKKPAPKKQAKPKKEKAESNNNNNNNAGAVKPAPPPKQIKKEPPPEDENIDLPDFDLSQPDSNFHQIEGDVTKPEGELSNKIILNLCTANGKWSNKGMFAALSNAFGNIVQTEYESAHKKLGDLVCVPVKKTDTEKLYVANIIALEDKSHTFNLKAFHKSLTQLVFYAKGKKASINLPKFSNPGLDWDTVEKHLHKRLSQENIPVYLYTFSKTNQKKRPLQTDAEPPQEAKEKKQKTEEKPEQDDPMDQDTTPSTQSAKPANKPAANNNNGNTKTENKEDAMDYDTEEMDDLTIGVESETPLEDHSLVFDSSNANRVGQLKQKAKELGAMYVMHELGANFCSITDSWQLTGPNKSTHLICSRPSEICKHVRRLGGTVLREEWVEQIYFQKRLIQEKPYLYRGGNELKQDVVSPQRPPRFELPCFFDGLSILLHKPSETAENLKRYIIAYAGEIVDDHKEASHVITEADWDESVDEMLQENKKLKVVTTQWAWSTINKKNLQSEKHYLLKKQSK